MTRFAEWLVLESFLDGLERKMLTERAVLDTLGMIARVLRENEEEEEEEEEDDGPVELDDPFSGDEDAKPKEMSPEAEKIMQNPAPEEKSKPPSGYVDASDNSEHLREIAKALRVIKADAIRKRAEEVENVALVLKDVEAADSGDLSSPAADPMDAIPTLARLGYFGRLDGSGENGTIQEIKSNLGGEFRKTLIARRGDAKRLTAADKAKIKERKRKSYEKLMDALRAAASEKGNEAPEGGFPSPKEVSEAKDSFAKSMNVVLGRRFASLSRHNQVKLGGDRVGHEQYEPNQLENEMIVGLLRHFTTRSWEGSGDKRKLMSWGYKDEILDLQPQELLGYLMKSAKREPLKEKQRASRQLSPQSEREVKSHIKNAPAKSTRIKADLKSEDLGFYLTYIQKAKESPLNNRTPGEDIVSATNKLDGLRKRIMQDIEREADLGTPGISMEPAEIRGTLKSFLHLLAPRYRQVVHASTLAKDDDSSEDAVLSGSERRKADAGAELSHSLESDDEFEAGGEDSMDAGQSISDSGSGMLFDLLKPFVIKAINDIAGGYTFNGQGAKSGPKEALALCIKFGLRCNVTTRTERGHVVPHTVAAPGQGPLVLNDRLKDLFRQASEREGWSWDAICRSAFKGYGINPGTMALKWSQYPSGSNEKLTPRSLKSMDEYLNGATSGDEPSPGGLLKLCHRMSELIRF